MHQFMTYYNHVPVNVLTVISTHAMPSHDRKPIKGFDLVSMTSKYDIQKARPNVMASVLHG